MSNPYSGAKVKRSAAFFLGGKFITGGITFITVLWLVRALPLEQYGVYVMLPLLIDIFCTVASLGIPWVIARYLPELRLKASGTELNRFVLQSLLLSLVLRLAFIGLVALLINPITAFLNIAHFKPVFALYLCVILLESIARLLRESVLGSLLMQREAQIALITRSATFLGLLLAVSLLGNVDIYKVVLAELVATLLGLALALLSVFRFCYRYRTHQPDIAPILPPWATMWRTGKAIYLGQLVAISYSNQVFVLLTQRFLGVEYTAVFGFMVSLYSQVFRYLPVVLLFNVFRPKWVANYVNGGGLPKLRMDTNLAIKLTVFTLMPVLILISIRPDELLALLSGGRFVDAGLYFIVVMLALLPQCQKRILETVAVIVGDNAAILIASFACTLVLPAAYLMFISGWGLWAPVMSMLGVHLVFNGLISILLYRNNGYFVDYKGLAKMFLTSCLLVLVFNQFSHGLMDNVMVALLAAAFICGMYLLLLYFLKPFSHTERNAINQLLKRRLFFW